LAVLYTIVAKYIDEVRGSHILSLVFMYFFNLKNSYRYVYPCKCKLFYMFVKLAELQGSSLMIKV